MNDFQSAADIPYTILPFSPAPGPVVDFTTLRNHLAVIQLSNARLDPSEGTSGSIASPLIADNTAYIQILNDSIVGPEDSVSKHVGALPSGQAGNAVTTNAIANFATSRYWLQERVGTNTSIVVRVLLMRTGTNFSSSLSVDYTADVSPNNQQDDAYNFFPLQPGSDYATPPNSAPASREVPRYSVSRMEP